MLNFVNFVLDLPVYKIDVKIFCCKCIIEIYMLEYFEIFK